MGGVSPRSYRDRFTCQSATGVVRRGAGPALAILLVARDAFADVPWAFILAVSWVELWWVIPVGLLIEWPAVHILTGRSWQRSLLPDLVMNLISMAIGLAILLVGTVVPILNLLIHALLDFTPSRLVALLLLAPALNSLIEGRVLHRRYGVPNDFRRFWILWAANSASVGVFTVAASMTYWRNP